MATLTDRLLAHEALADYSVNLWDTVKFTARNSDRIRALDIILEEAEALPPSSVLQQKIEDEQQMEEDSVLDGGNAFLNWRIASAIGTAIWNLGKRVVVTAGKWAWRGAKFVGRTALRFLIRGILMPVAGAIVGTIGLPAAIVLGLAGALTYMLYSIWNSGDSVDFKGINVDSLRGKERVAADTTIRAARQNAPQGGGFIPDGMGINDQPLRVGESEAKATPRGNGVKGYIDALDPDLIALGKANCFRSDNGVDVAGMNQDFMTIFYAMAGEYVLKGGRKVRINSAFRSVAKQKLLYDAWIKRGKTGGAVARPGRSRHNSGIAIDVQSITTNAMASMGLLRKYHFIRPVRGEAWHLENLLFGTGAATQRAVAEAKATASKVEQQREAQDQKPVEVSPEWLENMQQNPDKVAATDFPDAARANPSTYYNEQGKALSYREIYGKTQSRQRERTVDSTSKEVEVPKPAQGKQQSNGNDAPSVNTHQGQPNGDQQWMMHRGNLVSSY